MSLPMILKLAGWSEAVEVEVAVAEATADAVAEATDDIGVRGARSRVGLEESGCGVLSCQTCVRELSCRFNAVVKW